MVGGPDARPVPGRSTSARGEAWEKHCGGSGVRSRCARGPPAGHRSLCPSHLCGVLRNASDGASTRQSTAEMGKNAEKEPGRFGSRPGGTPQEISRGQGRARGPGPRLRRERDLCPSGASKKSPAPNLGGSRTQPQARARKCVSQGAAASHSGGKLPAFSSMPLRGKRALLDGIRGLRPLARTCPRLISAGVPPGREGRRDDDWVTTTDGTVAADVRRRISPTVWVSGLRLVTSAATFHTSSRARENEKGPAVKPALRENFWCLGGRGVT